MPEVIKTLNTKEDELSTLNAKNLSWKIFWSMWLPAIGILPKVSRGIARKIAIKFYDEIFKNLGINVNIKFSENAKKDFPNEVKALNEYILNGLIPDELLKYIPKLFVGNHTKGSIEATGAYYIVPLDTRIVLKDILTYILGVLALRPIPFYRNNVTPKATKKRNKKIDETIKGGKRVLLYPEGTRTDDGSILDFKKGLTSGAFKTIKSTSEKVSKIVTIITTDSHKVFPYKLEDGMKGEGKLGKGNVTITIDFIDASLYENVHDFNQVIKEIMENNLK